jgi:hypothetical protein
MKLKIFHQRIIVLHIVLHIDHPHSNTSAAAVALSLCDPDEIP